MSLSYAIIYADLFAFRIQLLMAFFGVIAICFHYLLTTSRRVDKWITSHDSLIFAGLYASNGSMGWL
jgi:hypothetical protein